ncbi:MAG: C13 family peptidase [Rhizomicrobium sp.]
MSAGWLRSWLRRSVADEGAPPSPQAPPPMDAWSQTGRALRNVIVALVIAIIAAGAGWYAFSHHQYRWAVVVVAGDWHAHDGSPSEAFDNSRRDVSAELRSVGFDENYMMQFSVRPDLDKATHPQPSTVQVIGDDLDTLAHENVDGCLLYFSSHGSPGGIVLGSVILSPQTLSEIIDQTCGSRPAVVIISACYSGVYVPALEGDDRMIMTAARPDRTSFGCGQDNRYPYFDDCVVHTIPKVHSFPELADRVKDCVSNMETETGVSPPSEPQVFIGRKVADRLPTW